MPRRDDEYGMDVWISRVSEMSLATNSEYLDALALADEQTVRAAIREACAESQA